MQRQVSVDSEPNETNPVRAWDIVNNPILMRYRRSRLRRRKLIPWALLVLIVSLFVVGLLVAVSKNSDIPMRELARLGLVIIIVLQSLMLLFLGTGAVAVGIIQESAEGMVEYQRLTPMTPLAKIVGYVFGLPIREYVLASLQFPFVFLTAWLGDIAWDSLTRFYLILFMAGVLYHLTGMVVGTVARKKFIAGRTAQLMVFLLYVVLPRFAHLGFIFLLYLTVLPAWYEQASPYLPQGAEFANWVPGLGYEVPWFFWEFGPTGFSFFIQGALIFVLMVILARRWRDAQAHLMANHFAVLVFAGIALLLLGNSYPIIESGAIFLTMTNFNAQSFTGLSLALVGVALLSLLMTFISLVTPTRDEARRGFRRAAKLKRSRVAPFSDDVTALWTVGVLLLIAIGTWILYASKLTSSEMIQGKITLYKLWPLAFAASLTLPIVAYHAVLEWLGARAVLLALLLAWIVPAMVAVICMAANNQTLATYSASLSGFLMPIYAVVQMVEPSPDREMGNTVKHAFWFAMIVYALLVPALLVKLQRYRRELMHDTGFRNA